MLPRPCTILKVPRGPREGRESARAGIPAGSDWRAFRAARLEVRYRRSDFVSGSVEARNG